MPYAHTLLTGALVGVLHTVLRVKAPAPPLIAFFGLPGMVAGQSAFGAL